MLTGCMRVSNNRALSSVNVAERRPALPQVRKGCAWPPPRSTTRRHGRATLRTSAVALQPGTVSGVLLAGGVGKRMQASMPKQYLALSGQPIAMYSFETLATLPEIGEIVIVCDPSYRQLFIDFHKGMARQPSIEFALPGAERQDSVFNGLEAISSSAQLVAIHDSARPLITAADIVRCLEDGLRIGAAVLGVPVKPTIKQVDGKGQVVQTLERANLWEVQTPQVIRPELLRQGFEHVHRNRLAVTDDVSIVESLGLPVHVTPGSYTNIKVTTPEDMVVAEAFLRALGHGTPVAA